MRCSLRFRQYDSKMLIKVIELLCLKMKCDSNDVVSPCIQECINQFHHWYSLRKLFPFQWKRKAIHTKVLLSIIALWWHLSFIYMYLNFQIIIFTLHLNAFLGHLYPFPAFFSIEILYLASRIAASRKVCGQNKSYIKEWKKEPFS